MFPSPGRWLTVGAAQHQCLSKDCEFSVAVLERSPAGEVVGKLVAEDPDRAADLSYSLTGGEGMFRIDAAGGELQVAGELIAARRNRYDLAVVVSDGTVPVPLTSTSVVHVSVELPLPRGSIAGAVYAGIEGSSVGQLTGHPAFPREPLLERRIGGFEVPPLGTLWLGGARTRPEEFRWPTTLAP